MPYFSSRFRSAVVFGSLAVAALAVTEPLAARAAADSAGTLDLAAPIALWGASASAGLLVEPVPVGLSVPSGGGVPLSGDVSYIPPVDAPVTDPFRPPTGPYGPGNRGIEYATTPGSDVVAAADGVVTFAGSVAGSLYVTVKHADGIRTTVSYLASVRVLAGQHVRQGDVVGTAGPVTHVSARRGDVYLDPATLWGTGPPRVFLVPLDGGPAPHDGAGP